ncbi:hypothetical protein [Streptomyces alboniger]|uniref:Uncharacterized protein n=1 Tax=Streptomyces alboniger TaxID=132473 RepID=A0A5J6HVN0_STRAD|nr:hypothetical protein [Streptomyces alboniger]QEV20755.1 hypothetical protein CP975_27285 [Streptomyces alboniger]
MSLALDLDTVMTILLIRFALIVGAVAVLVIIAFTILIVLKRSGRLGVLRRRVEHTVRGRLRALDRDTKGGGRS